MQFGLPTPDLEVLKRIKKIAEIFFLSREEKNQH